MLTLPSSSPHCCCLAAMSNAGKLMYKQGKFAQAEALFLRAMEGRVKVLGAEHAQTKDTEVSVGTEGRGQGEG